eukprot:TRINITY_DN27047_c0_g1_i1.p1 TRINITY_DN27047_c0_g1~~TRINITY_DN27047_c0_g1_i1.p1  ORF type:complete len:431 (-),score=43.76 TRINITY_DN27047_c0_g1_i1:181-1473(-)
MSTIYDPAERHALIKELRDRGCAASDFLGCYAYELRKAGFNVRELMEAGFTLIHFRNRTFTAQELLDAGFDASQLTEKGFCRRGTVTLFSTSSGFLDAVSVNLLLPVRRLLFLAALKDHALVGERCCCMLDGVVLDPSRSMLESGIFSEAKLTITCSEDPHSVTISGMGLEGIDAKMLVDVGFKADQCRKEGYSAKQLLGLFSLQQLIHAGFSSEDFRHAGYNSTRLRQVTAANFSLEELRSSNLTVQELFDVVMKVPQIAELDNAGILAKEFRGAGYELQQLIAAGFRAKQLKDAEFTGQELFVGGLRARAIVDAGLSLGFPLRCTVTLFSVSGEILVELLVNVLDSVRSLLFHAASENRSLVGAQCCCVLDGVALDPAETMADSGICGDADLTIVTFTDDRKTDSHFVKLTCKTTRKRRTLARPSPLA